MAPPTAPSPGRRLVASWWISAVMLLPFAALGAAQAQAAGHEAEEIPAAGQAPAPAGDNAVLIAKGRKVYDTQCSGCHGGLGFGTIGPKFRGNDRLAEDTEVVGQILVGLGAMPSFAGRLSDEQIAAVSSYIRMSWGNDYGEIATSRVEEIRHDIAGLPNG